MFGFFSRHRNVTKTDKRHGFNIAQVHDSLLKKVFKGEKYLKLYSYHYLINGFAVLVNQQQVCMMLLFIFQHHDSVLTP